MQDNIINYWYQQEFFNPCWPVRPSEDINLAKNELPWQHKQANPKRRENFDVYLGKVRSGDLIVWMLETLKLEAATQAVEKDNALSCLCALKVDEDGCYVADSFAISNFVWAVGVITSNGSFHTKLETAEIDTLQRSLEKQLLPKDDDDPMPVSKERLQQIFLSLCATIQLPDSCIESALWSHKNIQYCKKDGTFLPLDPSTELLPSFYLKDLDRVREKPSPRVNRYINAMQQHPDDTQRIEIDTDVAQMQAQLKAEAFPLGAWPSKHSPSLMQQLGINLAIAGEQDIFSINGPPGTGKTTLLKEIVVSNVVQRSLLMLSYDKPDDAFGQKKFQDPPDQYNQTFYTLDKRLSAYGILVASNNNAAVENISVDLPKAMGRTRTNRFLTADAANDDTYFSDIATKLLGEPSWGLISAKLGKRSNITALRDRLWWADDAVTLKRYYDNANAPNWEQARKTFRIALDAVLAARNDLERAQELLAEQQLAAQNQVVAAGKHSETKTDLTTQQERLQGEQKILEHLGATFALQQQNIETLKSSLPFLKRIFWKLFRKNSIVMEWRYTEQAVEDTVLQITRQRTLCQKQEEVCRAVQGVAALSEQALLQATQALEELNTKTEPYREKLGDNWADATFWENIGENMQSQTACPWTYEEYDRLREELFYQALMLNKAFILNSKRVQQNLKRLFALWDGKFTISDSSVAYGNLLNTLMLVVPVISTTFASVQTFLAGVGAEELGVLVVDEAGQATPQSALGALWRIRKAIVVGDPLQVEPIVTIPEELRKRFADENKVDAAYRMPELSVQVLSDQLNRYGGIRQLNDTMLWLGCPLVVHRRCLNPMFQISNEVAYNGRMFSKTAPADPAKKLLLAQSRWFHVAGVEMGNKNHAVHQQTELVCKLFKQAMELSEALPSLYIITPFTSVVAALKDALRPLIRHNKPGMEAQEISAWLNENCGTIHTFQGKEADEVLLVLGCDAQTGMGAARWVGQKPNIINVAVSRAKYRLGVIGDYELWQNIPYVQTVHKYLSQGFDEFGIR